MAEPLEIHRFTEGDEIDIKKLLVPAVVDGHEVDDTCLLWVINYGRTCTITLPTYEFHGKMRSVTIVPTVVTVRKQQSGSAPSQTMLGPFAPGTIKYDRFYKNLTVAAIRFDPKPPGESEPPD